MFLFAVVFSFVSLSFFPPPFFFFSTSPQRQREIYISGPNPALSCSGQIKAEAEICPTRIVLCRHAYAQAQISVPDWLPPSLSACAAGQALWPLIMAFLPSDFSCWSSLPKCHMTLFQPVELPPVPPHRTCHISSSKHSPLLPAIFTQAWVWEGQPDRGWRLSTMSCGRDNAGGVWQELPMIKLRRGSFLCMHTSNYGCFLWKKLKLGRIYPSWLLKHFCNWTFFCNYLSYIITVGSLIQFTIKKKWKHFLFLKNALQLVLLRHCSPFSFNFIILLS